MTAQQNNNKTIADILLQNGHISQTIYDEIKKENVNTGRRIEEIVKTHNYASKEQLLKAKSQIYNIPYVSLREISISPQALNVLPESVARRYTCFPYSINEQEGTLSIAIENPLNLEAIKFIEEKTKKRIKPAFAVPEHITDAIDKFYSQNLSAQISEALEDTKTTKKGEKVVDADNLSKIIKEAPLAKIVSTILGFAIKAKASDIHIEPQEDKTRVRYRIDGILYEKLVLPKSIHDGVVSRIKILSKMKIDEKRVPQDGRFTFRLGSEEVDLRVSSLPSTHGEKVVMRLLEKSGGVPDLPGLGLRGRALKNVQDAISAPHGIVLVCGPTGSGKTTTLYSALSKINTSRVNIITLEDPVEYEIKGVNQVQINPAAGLTFASGLRSFLRQDPDIIMVGEIRDEETAALAVHAALTGHLVFSTLHTNSAAGAPPRLLDMGAEGYLLASCMNIVIAQRVVRKICTHCKQEYQPPQEVVQDMKKMLGPIFPTDKEIKLYKGAKCPKCNQTGYSGRIGIFEVLPISEKVSRLILEKEPASKIEKQARTDGMITMTQDGYLKAIEGITTIEEVLRVSKE